MIPLSVLQALCFALPAPDCRVTSVWVDTHGVLAARLGERYLHASARDPNRPADFLSHSYRAGHLTGVPCSFAVRRGTFWAVSGISTGAGLDTDRLSLQTLSSKDLCAGRRPEVVAATGVASDPGGKRIQVQGSHVLWEESPFKYEMQLPSFGFDNNASLKWIEVVPIGDHACVQFDLAGSADSGHQLLATQFDASDPTKLPAVEKLGVLASVFGGRFRAFIVADVYYFLDEMGDVFVCDPDGKGGRKPMERLAGLKRPVRMAVTDARAKETHYLFAYDDTADEVEFFRLARKPKVLRCEIEEVKAIRSKEVLESGWAAARRLQEAKEIKELPKPK